VFLWVRKLARNPTREPRQLPLLPTMGVSVLIFSLLLRVIDKATVQVLMRLELYGVMLITTTIVVKTNVDLTDITIGLGHMRHVQHHPYMVETIKTNPFVREVDVGDMAPVVTLEIMEDMAQVVTLEIMEDMAPVVTLEIMEDMAVTLGDVPVEQNVTIMEMDMATIMEMDMAPVVV